MRGHELLTLTVKVGHKVVVNIDSVVLAHDEGLE